jgi:hypothetical protein
MWHQTSRTHTHSPTCLKTGACQHEELCSFTSICKVRMAVGGIAVLVRVLCVCCFFLRLLMLLVRSLICLDHCPRSRRCAVRVWRRRRAQCPRCSPALATQAVRDLFLWCSACLYFLFLCVFRLNGLGLSMIVFSSPRHPTVCGTSKGCDWCPGAIEFIAIGFHT